MIAQWFIYFTKKSLFIQAYWRDALWFGCGGYGEDIKKQRRADF